MRPTDEQRRAMDLFATGGSLAIEAGAGTGKTTTLGLLAATSTRAGQYVAFNKSIVEDSRDKFPGNVRANTAHSLAFRAIGYRYQERLNAGFRMTGRDVAAKLGIGGLSVRDFDGQPKVLDAGYLASLCSRAVVGFCQSADEEVGERHFPYVDGLDPVVEGKRTYATNNMLRRRLLPYARDMWEDLQLERGWVPYRHDHYLKAWQLSGPVIGARFILFDEAQDANPVIAAIVAAQSHAQLVYVGDSQQEIFGWTGAVNALGSVEVDHRAALTQSFRFGQAIADEANAYLDQLGAAIRLRGNPEVRSTVGPMRDARAVLTRTNATAVEEVLNAQQDGDLVHLIGGGADVIDFARGAEELQAGRRTSHADLVIFATWSEVQHYVANDPEGGDLRLLVSLVDKFGPAAIVAALTRCVPEPRADLVVTTTHKAKGREWATVRIGRDYAPRPQEEGAPPPDLESPEVRAELRLKYVAVTRGKVHLDAEALRPPAPKPAVAARAGPP